MDCPRLETSTEVSNPETNTTRRLGAMTMIPPNESRRNQIRKMAQKEEEELQRWKESHRLTHVHITPDKLGGDATLAQVRERQYQDLRCSKVLKKMKQENLARKKRQEENDEFQHKKDEQRKKAERNEMRAQEEQQCRRQQQRQEHIRVNSAFLHNLDGRDGCRQSSPGPRDGWAEATGPGPRPVSGPGSRPGFGFE
ncbi:epithelial-stromal interaction protein 1 isoform X2 [Nerophis ophidion]|uniref:epithelial-stromal interaction protein 1 isoform X2 n=1 Tax=Nerophis ophidion TaxID=159077 RepID=UPI002AE07824|nr:epithelial-stromal interaction protein 1 isoform X2 [Nerophis ophidion]